MTIRTQLGLGWGACLAVARNDVSLEEARTAAREQRKFPAEAMHDLISTQTLALMLGVGPTQVRSRTLKPGFPPPVGIFDGAKAWLRVDVEAHLRGDPVPRRDMAAIRAQYLSPSEVSTMIGLAVASLHNPRCRVPPCEGRLGNYRILRRSVVEQWMIEEPSRRKVRRSEGQLRYLEAKRKRERA